MSAWLSMVLFEREIGRMQRRGGCGAEDEWSGMKMEYCRQWFRYSNLLRDMVISRVLV